MKTLLSGAVALALSALLVGPVLAQGRLRPGQISIDKGTKTATATGGAATLNKSSGKITTESLNTAAAGTYTLTLTNSRVVAADQVFVSLANGTNTGGSAQVQSVTPGAGSVVIVIRNAHVSTAFNGTLVVSFAVFKA